MLLSKHERDDIGTNYCLQWYKTTLLCTKAWMMMIFWDEVIMMVAMTQADDVPPQQ